MVTFSVPIRRQGRFVGVVTADLAVDYFDTMRDSITKLDLGPDSYCIMVSAGGAVLVHPQRKYEFPSADSHLDALHLDASVCQQIQEMAETGNAEVRAMDPVYGKPGTFLFSQVPSAHWTFIIVKHGEDEPAPIDPWLQSNLKHQVEKSQTGSSK
jgi:hypothetical protein